MLNHYRNPALVVFTFKYTNLIKYQTETSALWLSDRRCACFASLEQLLVRVLLAAVDAHYYQFQTPVNHWIIRQTTAFLENTNKKKLSDNKSWSFYMEIEPHESIWTVYIRKTIDIWHGTHSTVQYPSELVELAVRTDSEFEYLP